jgi:hypothetical protein
MRQKLTATLAVLAIVSIAVPSDAHHGTSITYEMDKTITVSGTVTEFDFSYPHPSLFFDVTDEKGEVVKWGAEFLPTPAALKNLGWTKETIKYNDKVVLGCHPSKSHKPVCALASLSINGKPINVGGGPGVAPPPGAAPQRGTPAGGPAAPAAGTPRGQRQ